MNVADLILKKRDGLALAETEIEFLIEGYTAGRIPDYQMAAFCMAVVHRGMTAVETLSLTESMLQSGSVLDFSSLPGLKLDKHSTGGVGDKTSLIIAPLAAAAGAYVPMISGRGLGFTGGTLDKLESIPGFTVQLPLPRFRAILEKVGCAMIGQTEEIAPADRKLYALRDVTATVESIPLICASIMSKKLAEGLDGLVLDVKTGAGAFMPILEQASDLAQCLVDIGNGLGTRTIALITDMNQPLGKTVGNALEVNEAIQTLKGSGPQDIELLCEKLTARMLSLNADSTDASRARTIVTEALRSGRALEKFAKMVAAQGGDPRVIDDPSLLPQAALQRVIESPSHGFVTAVNAREVGRASMALGAGRETVDSHIDPSVGIALNKKIGDSVAKGEPLCTVFYNQAAKFESVQQQLLEAFVIDSARVEPPALIKRIVGSV
jgi:pyrimidine-nucleoside phosphorylase